MKTRFTLCLTTGFMLVTTISAQAATIDWNRWGTPTSGTISPVGLTVTYLPGGPSVVGTGTYSYLPPTTYADGTIIANAPTSYNKIMHITGGNDNRNTITFSEAVVDPVMAIWSLGQPGVTASFDFINATPTFVVGGPNYQYGGSAISVSGNNVSGEEGNGSIMFHGTFTSISWTNPTYENWYGFNVGVAGVAQSSPPSTVPLPASGVLMCFGLAGLGMSRRLSKSRKTLNRTLPYAGAVGV